MDKKKIGIIAAVVAVLVLAVGAGIWSQSSADRVQKQLDLAVKYICENDFEKAILAYNEAIKIDPREVKAYQGLARVYALQGKYDDAKAAYERGLAAVEAEKQITLRLGLAGMYVDQNKLAEAEKAFQEIKDANPNCLEAYFGLAMVYQQQGNNAKAESLLRQAVEKNPNDYRGYNTLALFLKQNGKAEEAFNNLVRSLTLEINQQEAYLVLSDMYKGRWSDLQAKVASVSDQQTKAMLEFYAYYGAENYQKALDIYRVKLAGQAGNHKARVLAAIAMFKTGDAVGAAAMIKQLEGEKLNEWLLSDIACYYQIAGDNEKAKAMAVKALQANGINLEAVALLQTLNAGEAKYYAAEMLLYNWKPVKKVKQELKARSLFVPEAAPATPVAKQNSNIPYDLSSHIFVPEQYADDATQAEFEKFWSDGSRQYFKEVQDRAPTRKDIDRWERIQVQRVAYLEKGLIKGIVNLRVIGGYNQTESIYNEKDDKFLIKGSYPVAKAYKQIFVKDAAGWNLAETSEVPLDFIVKERDDVLSNVPVQAETPKAEEAKPETQQQVGLGPIKTADLKIGPVSLATPKTVIQSIFGQPIRTYSSDGRAMEMEVYDGLELNYSYGKDGHVVDSIVCKTNQYAMPRGIRVGSTKKEVIDTYGEPSMSSNSYLTYFISPIVFSNFHWDEAHVNFTINDGCVTGISISAGDF